MHLPDAEAGGHPPFLKKTRLFEKAPTKWFEHNKKMCGAVKGLRPCDLARSSRPIKKSRAILLAIVPAFVSFVFVIVLVTWQCNKKKPKAETANEVLEL